MLFTHSIKASTLKIAQFVCCLFFVCAAQAQEAIPDFYKDPGIYPNRSYVNQDETDFIDPFTGSLQIHHTDIHLPGNGGFDLSVQRSYNTAAIDPAFLTSTRTSLGVGWTLHFGRVLRKTGAGACAGVSGTTANNPVLELPDGSRQRLTFTDSGSPKLVSPQRWRGECMNTGSGGIRIYSPEGIQYEMTQYVIEGGSLYPTHAYYTTKIIDPNGNYANITYEAGSHEIKGVTANDGRQIAFSYTGSAASRRITSIVAEGQTYKYDYTAVTGVLDAFQLASVTRPDTLKTTYDYNGNLNLQPGSYRMKQLTNIRGGVTQYNYAYVYFDTQSNPTTRTEVIQKKTTSNGGTWTFSYNAGGVGQYDVTTVAGPSGTTTYRHIGPGYSNSGTVWMVGLLASKAVAGLRTETYEWDRQKLSSERNFRPGAFVTKVDTETYAPLLTKRTITLDGATNSTTYSSFDAYGNAQSIGESGPNGGTRSRTLSYYTSASSWIIRKLKSESYTDYSLSREFDTAGNVTNETVNGVSTSFTYDGQGNVASKTFPRALRHTYSSHYRGIPRSESQPEGVSISRTVSGAGNVTAETNGDGRTTQYGYDGLNRITSITPPTGSSISVSYGANSRRSTRGSLGEAITYNAFGQPTQHVLGGITRNFTVDSLGRRTFESNPGASAGTSFTYDALDRLTTARNPDSTTRSITYGAGSRTVQDERGNSTQYVYRSYGDPEQALLMGINTPETSARVALARNGAGQITSVSQGGQTRTYGYNGNSYLTSVANPETGTTSYGRDAAGNMTSKKVGSSSTASFGYDGQNRLATASYSDSSANVSYSYNRTGKVLRAESAGGVRSYTYDANNNLLSDTLAVDGLSFGITYTYSGNDDLASITYPRSQRKVDYSPDALGRATRASGFISSLSYWPSGQLKDMAYQNGTTTAYAQNSRLWPSSIEVKKGSSVYANSTLQYDEVGNLKDVSDSSEASFGRTFGYDRISRLVSASGSWGSGEIAYDGQGNIARQRYGSSTLSYTYNSNRLSSLNGALSGSFAYDARGNVSSGLGISYAYDDVPNLRCVNCQDPTSKIEYKYDGSGYRTSVTKGGQKSYEMYDRNGNLLVEFVPAMGNRLVEHIYVAGKRVAQVSSDTRVSSGVTLVAAPSPVGVGQPATLTATVNGKNPTGSVQFMDGATVIGSAPLSAGKAVLTYSFGTAGIKPLRAVYSGDGNNVGSTSAIVNLTVNAGAQASTTVLTAAPNPAMVNQVVALKAIVTGNTPTGTVTFLDGASVLGTATISSGAAALNYAFPSAGTKNLKAVYGGNPVNASSTSAVVSLAVNPTAQSAVTLSASPNPAAVNQPVTFTATVTGNAPTGTVTFSDGATALGTATISVGKASVSYTFTTTGTKSVQAAYSGDVNNASANSSSLSLRVQAGVETTTTVTVSPSTIRFGDLVTVTATVAGLNPTGTVYFSGAPVNVSLTNGKAVATYRPTQGGNINVWAEYLGDASNLRSMGFAPLAILEAQGAVNLVASKVTNIRRGESVEFTAAVSPSDMSGWINFVANGARLDIIRIFNGSAKLSYSFPTVGQYTVQANISNSSEYVGTSNFVAISVGLSPTVHINSYPRSIIEGYITATGSSEYPKSGTVTVRVNGAVVGSASVNIYGLFSLYGYSVPIGTSLVTLEFSGDNLYFTPGVNSYYVTRQYNQE